MRLEGTGVVLVSISDSIIMVLRRGCDAPVLLRVGVPEEHLPPVHVHVLPLDQRLHRPRLCEVHEREAPATARPAAGSDSPSVTRAEGRQRLTQRRLVDLVAQTAHEHLVRRRVALGFLGWWERICACRPSFRRTRATESAARPPSSIPHAFQPTAQSATETRQTQNRGTARFPCRGEW